MVQWIRVLAISEDLSWVLSTHHVTDAPGDLSSSSGLWLHQAYTQYT